MEVEMETKDAPIMGLTPEEVQYITDVLLNAPMQVAVKDMPHLIGLVQSIVKKLQLPKPEEAKPEA